MAKRKILPELLKVNALCFVVIFVSFIVLILFLAINLRRYQDISYYVHDYADLTQYKTTQVLKMLSSTNNELESIHTSLEKFSIDLNTRVQNRYSSFLSVYSKEELEDLSNYLKFLSEANLGQSDEELKNVMSKLEDSYVYILRFSNLHKERMESAFVKSLFIAVSVLILFIGFVLFVLKRKITEIIEPLKDLTAVAEKLSISDEKLNLNLNYDYYEYKVLALSFRDMFQRINYENRVSSTETASTSVSHFVENIAHAVNNPLATVATSLTLVKKYAEKQDIEYVLNEAEMSLGQISRITMITHKMKSLINTSSKKESKEFEFNNIVTFIDLLYFNRFFEKNIKFTFPREDILIYGKEEIITSVLITLVENAIFYNDSAQPEIELSVLNTDNAWLIKIYDNGKVADPQDIYAHLLGDADSVSLGLYTSRKMAEDSGYNLYYDIDPRKEFVLEVTKK